MKRTDERSTAAARRRFPALLLAVALAAAPAITARAQDQGGAVAEGRSALDAGRYEEALTLFDTALEDDPAHRQAVLGRALALLQLDRGAEAIEVYDRLIATSPGDATALFYRGVARYRAGALNQAEADLLAALDAGVSFPIVYLRLGDVFYAKGEHEAALEQYRFAADQPGAPPTTQRSIGNAQYALGEYAAAEAAYGEALLDEPRDGRAAFYRAWSRQKLGRLEQALDDYNLAVELLGAADAAVFIDRGGLQRALGRTSAALDDYRTALDLEPENPGALYGAAAAMLDKGQVAAAKPFLEKLLGLAQADRGMRAAALFQRARARILGAKFAEAEIDLTKSLKLRPNDADAYYNRAIARLGVDDVAGALDDLKETTRLRPNDAGAHYQLGRIAIAAGMESEAADAARRAEALRHDGAAAPLDRGLTLLALDRPFAALTVFNGVLAKRPGDVTALRRKGDALLRIGSHQDALAVAETLIGAAPDDPSGPLLEAQARIALAEPDAARDALERANRLGADPATIAQLAGATWMTEARREGAAGGGGSLAQAEAALDAAVTLSSQDTADALAMRAAARERMGQYEAAKEDLDRAIGQRPQDPELRFARAGVLKNLDQCADAVRDYDAGLSLRPDNSRARAARASCKFSLGRYLGGVGDYIGSWF